jgi:hypothetical protein
MFKNNSIIFKQLSSIFQDKVLIMIKFKTSLLPRYIKVKVEHYLLFMFSPPKIS